MQILHKTLQYYVITSKLSENISISSSNLFTNVITFSFTNRSIFFIVSAILFGLVERICPADPIPELSQIQECKSDLDCDPRICCPDKPNAAGEIKFYCRTAAANLDKLPAPKMLVERMYCMYLNYSQKYQIQIMAVSRRDEDFLQGKR